MSRTEPSRAGPVPRGRSRRRGPAATDGYGRSRRSSRGASVRRGRWGRPGAAPPRPASRPAMPPTPVQRSKAIAACAMSISEPLARPQAPRARRRQERRLGRHVHEVEDRRRPRQQVDGRWSSRARACPTVVALTARSADRRASAKAAPSARATASTDGGTMADRGQARAPAPQPTTRSDCRRSPGARLRSGRRRRSRGPPRPPRPRRPRPRRGDRPWPARRRRGSRAHRC